jgi:hypothetical protein
VPDPSPVPAYLRELFDDARPLSADEATLARDVAGHLRRRSADHDATMRTLLVTDRLLPTLGRLVGGPAADGVALPVTVVVTGGAGALEPAVSWAGASPGVELRGLRTAIRESDAGDLAPNARRVVTVVDRLQSAGLLDEDVAVQVAPAPLAGGEPSPSWLSALDELAAADLTLALDATAVDSRELAAGIGAALDRELAFCCRGDLSRPFAVVGADGAVRHGHLGALLATRASLDGAVVVEVAAVLSSSGPAALAEASPDALVSARRWLRSVDAALPSGEA